MSFSWFRVEANLVDHPKVFALEAKLKDPNALAYVIRLFAWAHRFASDGRISNTLRDQVEAALRWRGERGKLLRALVEVGLIDATRRTLDVHDWPEYQGKLVEKSSRDAENKRKRRAAAKAETDRAARAGLAVGARTYTTDGRTDVTDGRSENKPPQTAIDDQPIEASIRGEKSWVKIADRLAVWLQAQRSLTGNFGVDRESDVAAAGAWAHAWVAKYEPSESAYDQLCAAFNAFLVDPWATERDCSLSLWVQDNVWRPRWDAERAKATPLRPPRSPRPEASP